MPVFVQCHSISVTVFAFLCAVSLINIENDCKYSHLNTSTVVEWHNAIALTRKNCLQLIVALQSWGNTPLLQHSCLTQSSNFYERIFEKIFTTTQSKTEEVNVIIVMSLPCKLHHSKGHPLTHSFSFSPEGDDQETCHNIPVTFRYTVLSIQFQDGYNPEACYEPWGERAFEYIQQIFAPFQF